MAAKQTCRPSALIQLHSPRDGWLAYQFDMAVSLLGRYIDGKLSEHDDKGKPTHTLPGLLADATGGDAGSRERGKYASPGKLRDL